MDKLRSKQSISLGDYTATVYQMLMSEVHLRIGLQNKCVELSIHITSALAAVVAGAAFAKSLTIADFASQLQAVFWLFGFYGFIQSLIVTNYIYHTFFLLRLCAFIRDRMHEQVKDSIGLQPGQLEGTSLPQDVAASKTLPGRLIFRFQPLVLYASVVLGWVIVSLILLVPPRAFDSFLPVWSSISIVAFLWCSLALLWLLLRQAHRLAMARALAYDAPTVIP